jgi:hypothetical protein
MSDPMIFPSFNEIMAVQWEHIVAEAELPTCSYITSAFIKHASEHEQKQENAEARVFRFLGHLTSMHLEPSNEEAPLRPYMITPSGRSAALEDFDDVLAVIEQLITATNYATLRARFADIFWLRKKDHQAAQIAANNYLEAFKLVEDQDKWVHDIHGLERGMALARILGKDKPIFVAYGQYIEVKLEEIRDTCTNAYPLSLGAVLDKAWI